MGAQKKTKDFQRWFYANGSLLVSFAIFKITRITTLRKVFSSSRLLKIQTIVNIGGRNMGAQKKTKNFQRWFYANGSLLVSFAIFKITRITTLRKVSSSSRLLNMQSTVNIGGPNMGAQKKTKTFKDGSMLTEVS